MADENKHNAKLNLYRVGCEEDDWTIPRIVICAWDETTTLRDVKAIVAAQAKCSPEGVTLRLQWPKVPGGIAEPQLLLAEWMVLDENRNGSFSIERPGEACETLPAREGWKLGCKHVVCRDCIVDKTGLTRHHECPTCHHPIMSFMSKVQIRSVLRGCDKCGTNHVLWSSCPMCRSPTRYRSVVTTKLLEFEPRETGSTLFKGDIPCHECVHLLLCQCTGRFFAMTNVFMLFDENSFLTRLSTACKTGKTTKNLHSFLAANFSSPQPINNDGKEIESK